MIFAWFLHDMILLDFAWCCMVLHDFGVLFYVPRGTPLLGMLDACWGWGMLEMSLTAVS